MGLRGFRTYISAFGGVLVALGSGVAAFQSNDWQAMAMAGSAGLISLAQIFQRSATNPYPFRPDTSPYDSDELPMNGGAR